MISHVVASLILSFILAGCHNNSSEPQKQTDNFGIFLLASDTLSTMQVKYTSLDSLTLDTQPTLSIDDIVSYSWSDHDITLTTDGIAKFKTVEQKIKSTFGLPFVVMVGKERIYLANIYPTISSYIHMDLPFVSVPPFTDFRIARAPDRTVPDKRNDQRIYNALLNANKIR